MDIVRAFFFVFCFIPIATATEHPNLDIYFIDVEGGQATLIVAPSGQSLLVDTGWPGFGGRDAERIMAAARLANLKRIDYVLITHYHRDHVGGVSELADRIPIGTFIEHGPNAESGKEADDLFTAYQKLLQKTPRRVVTPGDVIPLGEAKLEVLTANGEHVGTALQGQPNPYCSAVQREKDDPSDNACSLGI